MVPVTRPEHDRAGSAPGCGPCLRVLSVEDSEDDVLLVVRELERNGFRVTCSRVETRAALEAALDEQWDFITLDDSLPQFSGCEALALLAERGVDTPAVVVSGTVDERAAVAAMRAGARDFVTKQNLARLPAIVERELAEAEARREQRRAADALRRSEARFRSLIEHALDIVAIVDVDGHFVWTSPSFVQALGYAHGESVGADAFALVHDDDRERVQQEFFLRLDATAVPELVEYRFRHKDGSWRLLQSIGHNLLDDAAVNGIVVTSRDITERRQLQERVQQTQRLEAIGQLAGGVAHDFNNMLLVVRGYAAMLEEELRGTEGGRKAAEIVAAANHAAGLTRKLLAFGRRQTLQPTVLDVNEVVAATELLLKRLLPEDVELVVRPSAEPAIVLADVGQVEQVLANLVTNARDAMPKGGAITIAVETVSLDGDRLDTEPGLHAGRYVAIRVGDTGSGIDERAIPHIFDPFFTTKPLGEGTGLGLATVNGIVAQSGGAVSVETTLDVGSTFSVYFAAVESGPPTSAETGRDSRTDGSETVLVVEDSDQVRELTTAILRAHGYTVLDAACPSRALEISATYGDEIDLVVSDVVLPEMSGYELARRLVGSRPQLRSLFVSGYARGLRDVDGDLEAGGLLLQKPFTASELTLALRQVLAATPRQRSPDKT